jgi:hypothetical protein
MGSYKPVNGMMFPYSFSGGTKSNPTAQTTTIEKIEPNVAIPISDFAPPAALKQGIKPEEKR